MLRRLVYRIHFLFGSVLGLLAFFLISVGCALALLFSRVHGPTISYVWARCFGHSMATLLGWKLVIEGTEHFAAAPCIILANHQSNLDIATNGLVFPRNTLAVGKQELRKIPVFGWFFYKTKNVLLDRANPTVSRQSIAEAARRINTERVSVFMFPEGHRNQKDERLPFKKGAFHLAIEAQVPIILAVCEPIWTLLDARRGMVRPGRLLIRVLPPIPTKGLTADDLDKLVNDTHLRMQAECDALRLQARARIG